VAVRKLNYVGSKSFAGFAAANVSPAETRKVHNHVHNSALVAGHSRPRPYGNWNQLPVEEAAPVTWRLHPAEASKR